MATYKIQGPDGGTYQIEGPEGATQEQVQAEVVRQNPHLAGPKPSPINPYAGPAIQGADDPGKLGRILGYANKNPVLSDEAKIGLVTPPGVGSLMGRIGMAGAAQGAGALARGEGLQGAAQGVLKGAAAQGTGEALGAAVKGVRSLLPMGTGSLNKYAADREAALLEDLKQTVPAVKDAKTLRDAFQSQAMRDAVHKAYEDSLNAVKEAGKGKTITIPEEVAKTFGLGGTTPGVSLPGGKATYQLPPHIMARMQQVGGPPPPAAGMVAVDAAKAAEAMTGRSGDEGYQVIAKALDDAGIGDRFARTAYKTWSGYENFMDKFEGLKTGKLNLLGAQQALNTSKADPLLQRGLADKAAGVLMPTGKPIEQGSMRGLGAAVGGTLGTLGAAGLHLPLYAHGGGIAGGAYVGNIIGSKIPRYTGIPRTPINPDVSMLLNQYLQGALQQGFPKAQSTAP